MKRFGGNGSGVRVVQAPPAPAVAADPSVSFWLDFAESQGALLEDQEDKVLLVLPDALRSDLDLPEEVAVTADPEVAREDGALLLIPGHPVLDGAARRVIDGGDVGQVKLAWPASVPPSAETLLQAARESIGVGHGRIDLARAPPVPGWFPVLRVGAMVSYTVSVEERFQEREEVWVDGRTGLPMPGGDVDRMLATPDDESAGRGRRVLELDPVAALAGAHRAFEERAAARLSVLARQTEASRIAEVARVGAYYQGVLASIARRREGASEERRALFDSQAAATEAERTRRLQEVEESYRPGRQIRPFRLLEYLVPALSLPVEVRRGALSFPLRLVWMLTLASFAPVVCPHCSAGESLVAGRERLGCRSCLPSPILGSVAADPAAEPRAGDSATASAQQAPAGPAPTGPPAGTHPQGGPGPAASTGTPSGGVRLPGSRPRTAPRSGRRGMARGDPSPGPPAPRPGSKTGRRLAFAFWDRTLDGRRWPVKRTAPGSPLEALYRTLGPEAPLRVIGLDRSFGAVDITVHRTAGEPSLVAATSGLLFPTEGPNAGLGSVPAPEMLHPYTLRWILVAGKPVVEEVLPYLNAVGELFPSAEEGFAAAPRHSRDGPGEGLDPVASSLWRAHLEPDGLPFVARCLALWWRMEGREDLRGRLCEYPPHVVAAGIAAAVGTRSVIGFDRRAAAAAHGADLADAQEVGRALRRAIGRSLTRAD